MAVYMAYNKAQKISNGGGETCPLASGGEGHVAESNKDKAANKE